MVLLSARRIDPAERSRAGWLVSSVGRSGAWRQGPGGPIQHARCGPDGPFITGVAGHASQGGPRSARTPAPGRGRDSGVHNGRMGVPSGTVTLVFTDVEGSVRLWEADREVMA